MRPRIVKFPYMLHLDGAPVMPGRKASQISMDIVEPMRKRWASAAEIALQSAERCAVRRRDWFVVVACKG